MKRSTLAEYCRRSSTKPWNNAFGASRPSSSSVAASESSTSKINRIIVHPSVGHSLQSVFSLPSLLAVYSPFLLFCIRYSRFLAFGTYRGRRARLDYRPTGVKFLFFSLFSIWRFRGEMQFEPPFREMCFNVEKKATLIELGDKARFARFPSGKPNSRARLITAIKNGAKRRTEIGFRAKHL